MSCMSSCGNSRQIQTAVGLFHRSEETPGGCTWLPVYLLSWSPSSSSWTNRSQPSLSTARNTNSRYKMLSPCQTKFQWQSYLSYHTLELDLTHTYLCTCYTNLCFFYPERRRGPGTTWICSGCLFSWFCARSWHCPGTWRPPSSLLPT